MNKTVVVEVEQLVKRYDKLLALDHFDLTVYEGEILGLLGPNGCGKSTLINTVLGLLNYDKGDITVFGQKLDPDSYDLKCQIGVVPQEVALFDQLTVYENIDFFCGLYISEASERQRLVEEAIQFVELDKYRDFRPEKLSGGLKRRLNIACGIAHQPALIFLDEPTVAVDAQSRQFIIDGIKGLNANGSTIIYTTHYLDEAEQLCDRIVIMDSGQNVASGSIEELQETINYGEIIHLDVVSITPEQREGLSQLEDITQFEEIAPNQFRITFKNPGNNLNGLLKYLDDHDLVYTHLYSQFPNLNTIFLELTGKELRD